MNGRLRGRRPALPDPSGCAPSWQRRNGKRAGFFSPFDCLSFFDHHARSPFHHHSVASVDFSSGEGLQSWWESSLLAVMSPVSGVRFEGGFVDQQLKQLMKELGEAINESLSDSESIAEVVARIKEGGYDIFLVLEATIGVSKQGEHTTDKESLVSTLSTNADLKISDQDLKFLKSLRIKIDDADDD